MKLIPTSVILKFREFDRETVYHNPYACIGGLIRTNLDSLSKDIQENGFKNNFTLLIKNNKALLVDGNNRLACALRLNIQSVPVDIEYYDKLPDDSYKLYLGDKLHKMIKIDSKLNQFLIK